MNAVAAYNRNQVTLRGQTYEEISVGAVAAGLDATKAGNCWHAVVRLDSGGASVGIRYRIDGVDPTDVVGYPAWEAEQIELTQKEALTFRAIRMGGTNMTLRVSYLTAAPA